MKFSIVPTFFPHEECRFPEAFKTRGAKVCLDLQSLQIQSKASNPNSVTQEFSSCLILRKGTTDLVSK